MRRMRFLWTVSGRTRLFHEMTRVLMRGLLSFANIAHARAHTRTRTLLTTRFRWPRFVTMRFGSSVVPLHLVLLHRQHHKPLSVSSFHFHLSLLRAHVPCLLSGQDGGHTCFPSGRRVCVTLRITFRFGTGGVTVDFLVTPMKLWKSIGWKFGRKLPYLFRYLGKQEEMVLDTLVCRCLSFCFPLGYSTGLQVGLSTL